MPISERRLAELRKGDLGALLRHPEWPQEWRAVLIERWGFTADDLTASASGTGEAP